MKKIDGFDEAFEIFFFGCTDIYNKYMNETFPNMEKEYIGMKTGRKYVKVTRGNSVFCFVNMENGDVLKPACWKAPAKHARGNIFDENNGLGSITPYGVKRLR